MDLGLSGKSAAVMAASEGLGRASAFALAREGASVAICARREDRLRETAEEIRRETGATVVPVVADVSNAQDVERFVSAAANELRGLDVLVANSGGPPAGRFTDFADKHWQQAFDLVFMSTVRAIRHARPHLKAQGGGSIVCIQSVSVKDPIDHLLLSNAIRPGVIGLVKTLSREFAPDIRVNAVLPGMTDTARVRRLDAVRAEETGRAVEALRAERAAGIPLGRLGDPMDVGDAVAYLASERARQITGTTLTVDGGAVQSIL